jgi:hypothetical protein
MKDINVFKKKIKIEKAYVTNTRLMGVVGIIIYYKDFTDIYHLDFEEYGIDGFNRVKSNDVIELNKEISKIIGGLGGKLKKINEDQAIFLLKKACKISTDFINLFPILDDSYEDLLNKTLVLSEKDKEILYSRMCVNIDSDEALINYYIMRKVGKDKIYRNLELKEINFELTDKPQTLLKNSIKKISKNKFRTETLIDYTNSYLLITTTITVEGGKILTADVIETLEITSTEAAFILNKKEYIIIYYYSDKSFEEVFYNDHFKLMKKSYGQGNLYTEYNKNNNHVDSNVYFLNDDMYGIYYFTNNNQLIVASFEEDNIDEIIQRLKKYEDLKLNNEFVVDQSLIYSFITSKYNNFYNFLNLESRD